MRRTPLIDVPAAVSAADLISRLGHVDVVVLDVDDTLVPREAPAAELAARIEEVRGAAERSGAGRLVVMSNGRRSRAVPGDGVLWDAGKPLTRAAAAGIRAGERVAVVGDKILSDGLLAHRWEAEFYLLRLAGAGRAPAIPAWLDRLVRRCLFTERPLD